MVKNDSFSYFASPGSMKRTGNDTFNESFAEKNSFSSTTIFRSIQQEHDKICSVIRSGSPSPSQYQNSLNELISLFERCNEESTPNFQKLVLSVFLKLCANILSVLNRSTFQPTLYRLAQLVSDSVCCDETDEEESEKRNLQKWADRITYECSIHVGSSPKFVLDLEFNNDQIVDDLSLSNGRFQFVRTSIFESAKDLARKLNIEKNIDEKDYYKPESFLENQFPNFPVTPNADDILKSDASLLDVKLFLYSLTVLSSNITDKGDTAKEEPSTACQMIISKVQRECWKGIANKGQGLALSALNINRISKLVSAVRLIDNGSEDVRVLFEAWKQCLQPSTAMDEPVYQAVKQVAEVYRTKMNSLLANGVFYSGGAVLIKSSWERRKEVPVVFPLQFDYQFVNTDEAGHIGTIINSTEGYVRIEMSDCETEDEYDIVDKSECKEEEDDTMENTFATASERNSLNDTIETQFFSPMRHNRDSMMPESIGKLIRDTSQANTSMISTKSVIMTPSRQKTPQKTTQVLNKSQVPFHLLEKPNNPSTPSKSNVGKIPQISDASSASDTLRGSPPDVEGLEDEEEDVEDEYDDEEDPLEMELLESVKRHEESFRTPVKPAEHHVKIESPKKHVEVKKEEEYFSEDEVKHAVKVAEDVKKTPVKQATRHIEQKPKEVTPKKDAQTETERPCLQMSPHKSSSVSPNSSSLPSFVDRIIEKQAKPLLTPEEDAILIEKLLVASTKMLKDIRFEKLDIKEEKTSSEKLNVDELLKHVESKLSRCQIDMQTSINRLARLNSNEVVPSVSTKTSPTRLNHPAEKCLGCQPDAVQEKALRCLEHLAIKWDAEGHPNAVRKLKF